MEGSFAGRQGSWQVLGQIDTVYEDTLTFWW